MGARTIIPLDVVALVGLLTVATGCAGLGGVLTGRPDEVRGDVRSIDARRGWLGLRSDYGGSYDMRFDGRTRVVVGGRQLSVNSLRRGDPVRVRVEYDRYGQAWADRIELRRDARAGRVAARVERWDGVVRDVDHRRGWFVLQSGRYDGLRVHLGRDARRDDVRRFERLRPGDRVRLEVRVLLGGQAELVRFR